MYCPICSKEIKDGITICPFCNKEISQEVVENWKAEIEQVVLGYEEYRGIVHGLQKDAIQNGWGNRLSKKGRGWTFEFHMFKGWDDKWILTMTDIEGYGLTGRNMEAHEIPDNLPEHERLARFEHMRFSGGSSQGAGLFGRGKLLFTAASKEYYIIYDSLTHNGIYRLNRRILKGRRLKNYAKAYEGENAKEMLKKLTKNYLSPLTKSGTRIIIVNPRDEIIKDINDGSFIKYIEETWWQILQKTEGKIYVKTERSLQEAKIPKEFKNMPEKNEGKWKAKVNHKLYIDLYGHKFKLKKNHFIVAPKPVPPEIRGIYLYRREMKVADLDIRDIPQEIQDKFYGYVEIETNSDFEKMYIDEKVEGPEHYSVVKHKGPIRKLRKTVQNEFDKFKVEIGFGRISKKRAKEKTRRALTQTLDELHKKLSKLGISVGKQSKQKDLIIRVKSIKLPKGKNYVDINDEITDIKFEIENISDFDYKVQIKVFTKKQSGKEIETLLEQDLTLEKEKFKAVGPFSFKIKTPVYPYEGQIFVACMVKDIIDDKILATRNIPIIIREPPEKFVPPIEISPNLDDIVFPRGLSNRRVNYEESIRNIEYKIINNLSEKFLTRFKVRVFDTQTQPKQQLDFLCEEDISLEPYQEVTIKCPDLLVTQEKYNILDREKGKVILRAMLVALEDTRSGKFAKGDKLDKQDISFWVNMDSGKGIFEDYRDWEGGSDETRSIIQPEGAGYICLLNITHPAYEVLQENGDESALNRYAYNELLKQTLILLIRTDNIKKWPEIRGKEYKEEIVDEELEDEVKIRAFLGTWDYLYGDYFE